MLMPNQTCMLIKSAGNDVYGQPIPGIQSRERCSVVSMPTADVKSSVRSDSSASRGNAHEEQTNGKILLTAVTKAVMHDILVVRGQKLKIISTHPRFNAAGKLDHIEVAVNIWTK